MVNEWVRGYKIAFFSTVVSGVGHIQSSTKVEVIVSYVVG